MYQVYEINDDDDDDDYSFILKTVAALSDTTY